MQVQTQIEAERTRLIWMLEDTESFQSGTAQTCKTFFTRRGATRGICIGDGQTMPRADTFDSSPFSATTRRGFDIIIRRSDMRILYVTTHGTPAGNENLTGQQVLDQLRRIRAGG